MKMRSLKGKRVNNLRKSKKRKLLLKENKSKISNSFNLSQRLLQLKEKEQKHKQERRNKKLKLVRELKERKERKEANLKMK